MAWLSWKSCLTRALGNRAHWWGSSFREPKALTQAGCPFIPAQRAELGWAQNFTAGKEAKQKFAPAARAGATNQLLVSLLRLLPYVLGCGCGVAEAWASRVGQAVSPSLGPGCKGRELVPPAALPPSLPSHRELPSGSLSLYTHRHRHTRKTHSDSQRLSHTQAHRFIHTPAHTQTQTPRQCFCVTSALHLVTGSYIIEPTPEAWFSGSQTWLHIRILWGAFINPARPGHAPEESLHNLCGPTPSIIYSKAPR